MNKSSSVSFIEDHKKWSSKQDSARSADINNICNLVVRDMHTLLQSMFDGIDDSFFELANNARNNNEQNRFFEAMRDVRIKRKSIENHFKEQLEDQFSIRNVLSKKAFEKNSPQETTEIDSLSLVQNDDLEQEVAISSMTTKAISNFDGLLLQFHTRICNLYGASDISKVNLPFDIKLLTEQFSAACNVLEVEIKEKLIVYKQFDRYVLSGIRPILEEANKNLIRLGIMPTTIKPPIVKQNNEGLDNTEGKSTLNRANNEGANHSAKADNINENALPQFRHLLANIRDNLGPQELNTSYSPHLRAQFVSTQDLVSLLSAIQSTNFAALGHNEAELIDIQRELSDQISTDRDQPRALAKFKQMDEDLINIVSMLFEFIIEDYNLSAPIQVLISRLQIPILKVVIQDNSFFSSNNHPARKLLNSLAKAGIGCNETQNKDDALYHNISHTVQSVLDNFNGNMALFEKLNQEFEAFIQKEEKKSKLVELRTKESEIGQIKSKQAQRCVEDKLDHLIQSSLAPIPENIFDVLRGSWNRVMFLAYLKDDTEHQWERCCKTAENLIWCLQPFEKPKDRQYWIAIAPKVLKELRSGLEEVSYNTSGLEKTIVEVRTTLTNAFKQNSFNMSHNIAPSVDTGPEQSFNSEIEEKKNTIDSNLAIYLEQVEKLEPGTWLEFANGRSKQRCKLSTVISESNSYIFVNRAGLKACEKTKQDLAEDFRKKAVLQLEQEPIIDRAMSVVTRKLNKKANSI